MVSSLRPLLGFAGLALALLTAPAHADYIEIEFDLSGSTLRAVGGLITAPPSGSFLSAGAKLRIPGAGSATPSAGPGSLRELGVALTVDAPNLLASVTGLLMATQLGVAPGSLSGGQGRFALSSSLALDASGLFACTGLLCGAVGSFPLSLTGSQNLAAPITWTLNGLSSPGAAQVAGGIALSLSGRTAWLDVVGSEVSRSFVPEPRGLGLLATASALLGLLVLERRRRGPRRH